jgi:NAD(P)-dependent dehydrogenase (short-subunit alcohol dehydrogenase family)
LKNKVVLVTGGANGIGASIVRAFHSQQSRVFFCDLDAAAGRALERELPGTTFQKISLLSESEISRWIDGIARREGRIGVLVNNAARDPRMALAKSTSAFWDELFANNLRAYFLTAREAAPRMKAGGSIVNFASITFHNGPVNMSAYVATKGGVLGLTRSLARELGRKRIRVNAISPGWIMTERQQRMYVTPAIKKLIRRSQCVPDLLQPEEMAEVVLFLASNASRAITGQEILADRGWEFA